MYAYNPSSAVFNGGTYTGGNGGSLSGSANQGNGGAGGNGLYAFFGTDQINAGTYVGGNVGLSTAAINTTSPGGVHAGSGLDVVVATVNIAGGTFVAGSGVAGSTGAIDGNAVDNAGTVNIMGGTFSGLVLNESGVLTIYGSNFAVNGSPVGYGALSAASGTLTGLLQNNAAAGTINFSTTGGTIVLAASVPEPSSLGLLTSVVALRLARRRRTA